jgi:hypothetical protein
MDSFPLVGSISHGTCRAEDLIPSFLSALDSLQEWRSFQDDADSPSNVAAWASVQEECGAIESRMCEEGYFDSDSAMWDLEWLHDTLDNNAPSGFTFGAHEGDGSDFGFWRVTCDCACMGAWGHCCGVEREG